MIARTQDETHLQLEPSDINEAERVSEARKTSQATGTEHQLIPTTSQSSQISRTTRLNSRRHKTGLSGRRLRKQQTQTTIVTRDPHCHDNDSKTQNTRTNNARDGSPRSRRRRRQRRSRHTTCALPNNSKLILNKYKATTTNKPAKQQAVSCVTLFARTRTGSSSLQQPAVFPPLRRGVSASISSARWRPTVALARLLAVFVASASFVGGVSGIVRLVVLVARAPSGCGGGGCPYMFCWWWWLFQTTQQTNGNNIEEKQEHERTIILFQKKTF